MTRSLLATAALSVLLALSVAGCRDEVPAPDYQAGGAATRGGYEGPRPEGVSDADTPITSTYYIPEAAISDMYEVAAAEIALTRASNPAVRAFAEQMAKDHGAMHDALKSFVMNNPVNRAIPTNMDQRRSAMIQNLRDASDQEFDRTYLGQQAAAHQEAHNLHMSYANNGMDQKLATLAKKAASVIQSHEQLLDRTRQEAGLPE